MKGYGEEERWRSQAKPGSDYPDKQEPGNTYDSAKDFEQALTSRLKQQAKEEGTDYARLRKRVAFDRFLSRVFKDEPGMWRLKGGYALEVRFGGKARATKDLDLSTQMESEETLLKMLDSVVKTGIADYFRFTVRRKKPRGRTQPGSVRFSIGAYIGGKTFEEFSLDIGLNEPELLQSAYSPSVTDLSFAGISKPDFKLFSIGEHFAEKFHAYTRPYENPSRVKDLVDMTLIIESSPELLSSKAVSSAIDGIFQRCETHPFPKRNDIPLPPKGWKEPFESEAKKLGLGTSGYIEAHEKLCTYIYGSGE